MGQHKYLKVITEKFPKIMKDIKPKIQENQKRPNRMNTKKKNIMIQTLKKTSGCSEKGQANRKKTPQWPLRWTRFPPFFHIVDNWRSLQKLRPILGKLEVTE